MAFVEIERKFLVHGAPWIGWPGVAMVQAYVAREEGRAVRVRVADGVATLTLKGPSSDGTTRAEVELTLPADAAAAVLAMALPERIEKTRYYVDYQGHTWEIDVFDGSNAGLVVAELELSAPDTVFPRPPWLDREVTYDRRYANAALLTHPWSTWGPE